MLPSWNDIKQLAKDLSKVRPKHVVALLRAAQDDPSLKKALKKTRTRLIIGFGIGAAGTIIIITQAPPALAAIGIGLGSKIVATIFAGSAFKETLHAVREHKDEIMGYLPGRTPPAASNDNAPSAEPAAQMPGSIKNDFDGHAQPEDKHKNEMPGIKPGHKPGNPAP